MTKVGVFSLADGSLVAAAEKGHPRMGCSLDIWSKFWHSDGWLLSTIELRQAIITRRVSFMA